MLSISVLPHFVKFCQKTPKSIPVLSYEKTWPKLSSSRAVFCDGLLLQKPFPAGGSPGRVMRPTHFCITNRTTNSTIEILDHNP